MQDVKIPGTMPVEAGRLRRGATILLFACGLALSACAAEVVPPSVATADNARTAIPLRMGGIQLASASGRYLAGRHARRTRDFGSAADFLSDALTLDAANQRIRRQIFFALVASGRMEEAIKAARIVVAANKDASTANLAIAIDDLRAGRYAKAAKRLSALPRRGMNNFTSPLLLGWTEAAQGNPDKAIAAIEGLSKVPSLAVLHHLHSGYILEMAGRKADAEAAFIAAGKKNQSLRVVQAHGQFLERVGRADEAKALYDALLVKAPGTASIEAALVRIADKRQPPPLVGNPSEGIAEVFFNLAGTLAQGRSVDLALVYGRFALHMRPDFPIARVLIAGLLESLKRREDAIAMYNSVKPDSALFWSSRLRKAAALDDLGRTDEAVAELRRMVAERPGDPEAAVRLGDMFRAKDRFDEAIAGYSDAIKRSGKLERQHWSLLYARGIAYERAKRWPDAEADFLQALKLSPEQPYVLNYLGYSWVDQGLHLDKAQGMIRRAVKLRPNDGYIVDSLGWVLYRLGEYSGAAKQLERAVVLRPEDPTINDHLGDAYWRVGRLLEARFQWRRALSLKPEAAEIPKIEQKLRQGLAANSGTDERG
ncbi:MAG: tetratricopeptide repeat protein [Alphaproteobacteria bacterium]